MTPLLAILSTVDCAVFKTSEAFLSFSSTALTVADNGAVTDITTALVDYDHEATWGNSRNHNNSLGLNVTWDVNDDLTISYEVEKSNAQYLDDANADVEQKSTGVQLAYNLGGMTLAIARNSHDNPSYSSTAADIDQTLIAVTMAF